MLTAFLAATTRLPAAELEFLPTGVRLKTGTPVTEYQCYGLEDFKTLLKLNVAHSTCVKSVPLFEEKLKLHDEIVVNLKGIVAAHENSIVLLKADNTRLYEMWKSENLAKHQAENKPNFSAAFGWGSAGVMGIVAVVLGIVVVAK